MPKLPPPRSKKVVGIDYMKLLRLLDKVYQELYVSHSEDMRHIGNRIPAGGGHMDTFFRLEGLRGAMTSLRMGEDLEKAIQAGKDVSSIAVLSWNNRREYQVHRWDKTAHDFVENTVRRLAKNAQAT